MVGQIIKVKHTFLAEKNNANAHIENLTISTYTYDGEFNSIYTACFGGPLAVKVGRHEKVSTAMHRTFGGDSNYMRRNVNPKNAKKNFEEKFPNQKPAGQAQVSFIDIGNHERNIEGSKSGDLEEVAFLSMHYPSSNVNIDPNNPNQSFFLTHEKKYSQPNLLLPHLELFHKDDASGKFAILHIDSNLLPLESYGKMVFDALLHLKDQYPDYPIVISQHHAPKTYGARVNDHKDAKKYVEHLNKIHLISQEQKEKFFKDLDQVYNKWQENGKEKLKTSPFSWNKLIAQTMKIIYQSVYGENFKEDPHFKKIIAYQSGHDHYASLMVKPKGPLAILQGNGAQEGRRLLAESGQHVNPKYFQKGKNNKKLYGCDADQSSDSDELKYLRLGFGEWTLTPDGKPIYTQYYFADKELQDISTLRIATQTIFDGDTTIIKDYLHFVQRTVKRGAPLKQEIDVEEGEFYFENSKKITQFLQSDILYDATSALRFDLCYFIEHDKAQFKKLLIHAYQNQQISFNTLIQLNRLTLTEKTSIPVCRLEATIDIYKNNNKRGVFRRLMGSTQTIKDLEKLAAFASASATEVFQDDIELILTLRDQRESYFRQGIFQCNSTSFFKAAPTENLPLSNTEEAIADLRTAFRR